MTAVQRYTWEDALIEAEKVGVLKEGPVNTGLRLARVINWSPNDGRPSGLYWKNELAADVVGVSRATLFRNIKPLKEAGYLVLVRGNLLPAIPESHIETREAFEQKQAALIESHTETGKSHIETKESHIETGESQCDNPYSEDTYTEDVSSEETLSEAAPTTSLPDNSDVFSLFEEEIEWDTAPEEVPKSHIETDDFTDQEREQYRIYRNRKRMGHQEARALVLDGRALDW